MSNEVTYYKTWYKYPETNPTMLEDYDSTKEYEICWHWNKGSNKNMRFIENNCIDYDPELHCWLVFDYHEGMNPNDILEINFEQVDENGYYKVIESWSEISFPVFDD